MTDIDKAREWADRWAGKGQHIPTEAQAAIDLIKSLPDAWVDTEKVRKIIKRMESTITLPGTNDHWEHGFDASTEKWANVLNALVSTTLADMTQEEREACQWMQARYTGSKYDHVIVRVHRDNAMLLRKLDGMAFEAQLDTVVPLPDLPKLKWPAQAPRNAKTPPAETLNNTSSDTPRKPYLFGGTSTESDLPDISVSERMEKTESSIKPEDVPPNEPWLIEVDGEMYVGTRYAGNTAVPWSFAVLDGSFAGGYTDHEVTLIHKLVAKPPALPEGMRLADHKEFGRVVASPRSDDEGDFKVFRLNNPGYSQTGAFQSWVRESELTFLDGEQHV